VRVCVYIYDEKNVMPHVILLGTYKELLIQMLTNFIEIHNLFIYAISFLMKYILLVRVASAWLIVLIPTSSKLDHLMH